MLEFISFIISSRYDGTTIYQVLHIRIVSKIIFPRLKNNPRNINAEKFNKNYAIFYVSSSGGIVSIISKNNTPYINKIFTKLKWKQNHH
jgi:hypothetical protein